MNTDRLTLEVIAPDGSSLHVPDVDVVIVRRKEHRYAQGSEVAIFPRHAPTLIRVPIAPLRYQKGEQTEYLVAEGGFVEVKRDQVLLVTSRFEEIRRDEPEPSKKASQRAAQWTREAQGFGKEILGY